MLQYVTPTLEVGVFPSEMSLKIRQNVMWPEKSIEFVKVAEDKEGTHFGLFEDNKIISVISLFYKDKEVQFI